MKNNTKKLTINSILLAIGLILHELTPAIGLPIQPDMSLIMLFTIMILNKDDFKTVFVCGVITGIFTALTTKFPGGQLPNVVDKVVTTSLIYMVMYVMYRLPLMKKLDEIKQNFIVSLVILPIGTFVSGCVFLGSASLIVGLPGSFYSLFMVAVAPAVFINLICGIFVIKVVELSVKRIGYSL